jgi:hypothetical protein
MAVHQFNEGKLDVKANILMWWKLHAVRFPYLSRLARRYFAMPATSDSVERLFSVSGQVVTNFVSARTNREAYEIIEAAM